MLYSTCLNIYYTVTYVHFLSFFEPLKMNFFTHTHMNVVQSENSKKCVNWAGRVYSLSCLIRTYYLCGKLAFAVVRSETIWIFFFFFGINGILDGLSGHLVSKRSRRISSYLFEEGKNLVKLFLCCSSFNRDFVRWSAKEIYFQTHDGAKLEKGRTYVRTYTRIII